ncbi:MAG: ubiquinol-cytochrome c reductase iron-sulfur subunit [Vicinamibacterales bacterium]
MEQPINHAPDNRRGFLIRIIQTVHAGIGATLAFIVGGAIVAPSFSRREKLWLPAGSVPRLVDGVPTAVSLRIARSDGASETVDRRVVYLVKTGEELYALDSTCTHLGCRTKFNADSGHIECPCHGGVYDTRGNVVSGPPPTPLAQVPVRVEHDRIEVQV